MKRSADGWRERGEGPKFTLGRVPKEGDEADRIIDTEHV